MKIALVVLIALVFVVKPSSCAFACNLLLLLSELLLPLLLPLPVAFLPENAAPTTEEVTSKP